MNATPIEQMLTNIAEEEIRLRTHPTAGVYRYIPTGDPTIGVNAVLWRERGMGGWSPDPAVAAAALAHELGLHQGRAEAMPLTRVAGKVELLVVAAVGSIAASTATERTVIAAAVKSMPAPAPGARDRRAEFAKRAFKELVVRGALVIADGVVAVSAACRVRKAVKGQP